MDLSVPTSFPNKWNPRSENGSKGPDDEEEVDGNDDELKDEISGIGEPEKTKIVEDFYPVVC